ncbi:hypothetical protein PoB_007342100 [Plakobranchus ocellatus]|uniref:Uncharacterized protein n=1 Tax=Plakobranchus ocellatus TaxID=259542 RepID=A0AAV4DSN9_9GAST|nr:hypothetical protein PoB_007342100 [Plakobranchus ocellatus]
MVIARWTHLGQMVATGHSQPVPGYLASRTESNWRKGEGVCWSVPGPCSVEVATLVSCDLDDTPRVHTGHSPMEGPSDETSSSSSSSSSSFSSSLLHFCSSHTLRIDEQSAIQAYGQCCRKTIGQVSITSVSEVAVAAVTLKDFLFDS